MSTSTIHLAPEHLHSQSLYWVDQAKQFIVCDGASWQAAGEHLLRIKALMKEADDAFDPIISKAHAAHKEALAQKARITAPLTDAQLIIKLAMSRYETEQRRLIEAEERRLRVEAERKAEEEREAQILEAESQGATTEEVAVLAAEPLRVAPVMLAPPVPKVSGISTRQCWKAQVTNLLALVQHIAKNPHHLSLVTPNQVAINAMVRGLTSGVNIPGIKVWQESSIAASSGRRGSSAQ